MGQSRINWKQGDYITLGKAVSKFNKRINELENEENKLYLPERLDYSQLKGDITTRSELKRVINSLKRFQREDAGDLYTTAGGEKLTKWERKELGIQSRIGQSRLTRELNRLNAPLESGYSKVQMGSVRAREVEAQIRNLRKIEEKVGYEFKQLRKRIKKFGTSDFTMKKAITFRENYINEMKKYSHFDNYDKLVERMNKLKNPVEFYNSISEDELISDLTYQSDEYYSQQEFNSFIENFGVNSNEMIDSTQSEEMI